MSERRPAAPPAAALLAFGLLLHPTAGFTFLSIGDWGAAAAKRLNPWMGQTAPEFIIGAGDNFYSRGLHGFPDQQFQDKFEDTFTAPSLNVTWYVTSGNHDYYGGQAGIDAEIEYSDHSNRWHFPDYYYNKELTTADGTTILIVAIDTWRINGGDTFVKFDPQTERMALHSQAHVEEMYNSGHMLKSTYDTLLEHFEEEDADDPIPWNPTQPHDQVQMDWIASTLTGSDADWKVVVGHFPIYSATQHEHGESPKLVKYLDPILHQTKADMYFSGHDHILQHTMREGEAGGQVHYFGPGAGAMKHTGVNQDYPGLLGFAENNYGFMLHEGNKSIFTTTFVMADGTRPYNYTITKPGAFAPNANCLSGLQKTCAGARYASVGNCFVCTGVHQVKLQDAGCDEHQIDAFCTTMKGAPRGGQSEEERLASGNDGSSPRKHVAMPPVDGGNTLGTSAQGPSSKGLRSKQH